ncbi:hypothetical protein MGYG_08817 [Nannizzia gypsea CBS 118893]|uniref:Uncharacterized protein n=1 Tax=Arthroderma gypseum (strain ATCC MYA-4604 / CBS 118893) TaxID=535722 RepID=E4V728_ARTGP|nr:hypothetical protein MGYG_08817 [Nannizzia gypsea CBS 118893]EFQ96894.1 hypothetical protein MGYG_08817 [Nannizzia gypsea CBS 118893]
MALTASHLFAAWYCSGKVSNMAITINGKPATALPDENAVLDVIIIGAGPAGLAVASRLNEETPSAMFTDEEHQRYHWIKKHSGRMALVQAHHRKMKGVKAARYPGIQIGHKSPVFSPAKEPLFSTLVLDSSGDRWLSKWRRYFKMLEIQQLRSPMFFHVDPGDRDGMLAYARETGREKELWELHNCVGRELSKHKKKKKSNARITGEPEIDERDRKDYYSPGTELFLDYCDAVASRYGLDKPGHILQRNVNSIKFDYVPELPITDKIFTVTTKEGDTFFSRTAVLAVGTGEEKVYPWKLSADESLGADHIFDIKTLPSPKLREMINNGKETHVLVVGGGLTSAQISDVVIRKGVTKVWLLMRSDLKKVEESSNQLTLWWCIQSSTSMSGCLGWGNSGIMKRLLSGQQMETMIDCLFAERKSVDRFDMINEARNGGSINPRYHKVIKKHMANSRLSLHTRTEICHKTWAIATEPPIPDLPAIDYVYFATGVRSNVKEMPMLRHINEGYPIEDKGGLPCITDDLMWKDAVPLFARVDWRRCGWAQLLRTSRVQGPGPSASHGRWMRW